jgi:tetratricopeptide (TPR) repeat protein
MTLGTLDGLLVNQVFSAPPEQIAQLLQALNRTLAGMDQASTPDALTRSKLLLAIGRLSLAAHDSALALAERDRLAQAGDTAAAHSLDAFLAARAGRTEDALRHLDAARRPAWFGLAMVDPYFGEQAERFLLAELLFKQGRLDESLRWYGTFGEFAIEDLPYLARAEQRRAEIFERLGRTADAVESLKRAVGLWAHADPQIVPTVIGARRSLARLGAAKS